MNRTKHWTALCVCCLCNVYHTVLCLKRNLWCSVNVHSAKNKSRPKRRQNCITEILSSKGSSGGSCIFPLATEAMLAFSHPFAIRRFPRNWWGGYTIKLTSQVACEGLITESLRSTSISSFVTPDCIWVLIWLANQLVNWLNYKKKIAVNQKKSARCN